MTMHIYVAYKSTRCYYVLVLNFWCISQLPMPHVSIVNKGWNYVSPLVAPPDDLWDRLVRWLQVQPGEIDDYTTASNICLRISNNEYCSTRLRILINSLGPRQPRCKFKSSAAPRLAIIWKNYANNERLLIIKRGTNLYPVSLCRNDHNIETWSKLTAPKK